MFNLPQISESFEEAVWAETIRETDQLPVAYGKTFEEFYGLPPREEIVEEAPKPKVEIAKAHVRVLPKISCSDDCIQTWSGECVTHRPKHEETQKRKFEVPWPHLTSLSTVEEVIRGLDLSEWGYMSEHWQGKSKFYLTLKRRDGATHYRISESAYEIIQDRHDSARKPEVVETPKIVIKSAKHLASYSSFFEGRHFQIVRRGMIELSFENKIAIRIDKNHGYSEEPKLRILIVSEQIVEEYNDRYCNERYGHRVSRNLRGCRCLKW